ncbi:glycosyltransferase family 31 protein [Colletotrichum tofieldiae]|nr:glycosyltransferase family 31 protein [Colletotrichum tofieldiae]
MLSRRALTVLALVSVTAVIFLISSRRLGGDWAIEGPNYHPFKGHGPPTSPGSSPSASPSGRPQAPPPPSYEDDRLVQHNVSNQDIPYRPHDPVCDTFPDTSNILVVMKTGATESFDKVPTQLMTMLKCLPEYFIFSDLDQTIANYHVRDSLDGVLPEAMEGNKDFDLYRRQKACQADQQSCNKLAESKDEGWNLDKYKNVHIAEKTYHMRPNYDWYVYIDADTYVLWPTLVQWLKNLNPKNKHYLGSVTMIRNFVFGHGGSGYIVSQAAMHDMIADHQNVGNQWDLRASKECCGDYIFALAMKDNADVNVHNVVMADDQRREALHPPVRPDALVPPHRDDASHERRGDLDLLGIRAQALRRPEHAEAAPVTRIKDIYNEFFKPRMQPSRADWDNLADDRFYLDESANKHEDWQLGRAKTEDLTPAEKEAHLSFGQCRTACEADSSCFSFQYKDGLCSFAWSWKLGHPVKPASKDEKRVMSGWAVDKINAWIEKQGECGPVKWPDV